MTTSTAPFVHFYPSPQDFERSVVLRRIGAIPAGERRWCHVLSLRTAEVAHSFLTAGTMVAEAALGSPAIAFRIEVDDPLACRLPAPSHGRVTCYPDGRLPPLQVRAATHEFLVLGHYPVPEHVDPADITAGSLADIWRLILLLRNVADLHVSELQVEHLWQRAFRHASGPPPCSLERACAYFDARWYSTPRVREAAAEAGTSAEHLARAFRSYYGIAPTEYLRHLRMSAAAGLLWGSRIVASEIAVLCGFYDQAHMSREIRHLIGFSPLEFRHLAPCLGKRELVDLTR